MRKLLLGDWHPLCRDPIDVARYAFAVAAVVYAALGGAGPVGVLVAAAAVVGVRFVQLPRPYDAAFILAMTLTGWGEALRVYDAFPWYDVVVHALVPLFGSQIAYVVLARADLLPDPADDSDMRHYVGVFGVTLALGLALGAVWEMLEFASDHTVGSSLQLGLDDTMADLAADLLGSAVGAGLLVVWTVYGWGTVRRAPPAPTRASAARARETAGRD